MDVLFTPEATADEVRAVFAGAALEALPEAPRRMATPAEADELRPLIADVLRDDSEGERADALALACADPDAALRSLRALLGGGQHER